MNAKVRHDELAKIRSCLVESSLAGSVPALHSDEKNARNYPHKRYASHCIEKEKEVHFSMS